MFEYENEAWEQGFQAVAGVDEVGRGSLAGPVVAAAVIFDTNCTPIAGINDSKKLSPLMRERLYTEIINSAISIGIGVVNHTEIDKINILQATFKAMKIAVKDLIISPDLLLIDGNKSPDIEVPVKTIVGGDGKSYTIAAASIVAKVTRDRMMVELDEIYPEYKFKSNKGYASKAHINAIQTKGMTKEHRQTFCQRILSPQLQIFK